MLEESETNPTKCRPLKEIAHYSNYKILAAKIQSLAPTLTNLTKSEIEKLLSLEGCNAIICAGSQEKEKEKEVLEKTVNEADCECDGKTGCNCSGKGGCCGCPTHVDPKETNYLPKATGYSEFDFPIMGGSMSGMMRNNYHKHALFGTEDGFMMPPPKRENIINFHRDSFENRFHKDDKLSHTKDSPNKKDSCCGSKKKEESCCSKKGNSVNNKGCCSRGQSLAAPQISKDKSAGCCGSEGLKKGGRCEEKIDLLLDFIEEDEDECCGKGSDGKSSCGCSSANGGSCFCRETKKLKHVHGPDCGHIAVYHDGHLDYIVDGILHHPHGGHCDDHGPVEVIGAEMDSHNDNLLLENLLN